jgi:hypothetical protein
MKKTKWWDDGNETDQLDVALRKATVRRGEIDKLKSLPRSSAAPLDIRSINDVPKFIKTAELAEKIGCAPASICRDIREGLLHAQPFGRDYLINPDDVPAYFQRKAMQKNFKQRKKSA